MSDQTTIAIINEVGNDIGVSSAGKPRRKLERVLVQLSDGSKGMLFGTVYLEAKTDEEVKVRVQPRVRPAKFATRTTEEIKIDPAKAEIKAKLLAKLGLSAEDAAVLIGG